MATLADCAQRVAPDASPPAGARAVWTRIGIAWAVMAAMLLVVYASAIATMRFGDPDDALRLLEVRDWLAGQAWFDVHQYRIAAPEGVAMHWSRLVDIPLATVIVLLRPLLGTGMAEMVAVVLVPLLTLACTMALTGRLAGRLFDAEAVAITCLVTGIAAPMLFQMTPLRIDHHGWQVVLALAALSGLAMRDPWRGGPVIGLALAALLAISIEGLPLTAVFLGVCALRGLDLRGLDAGEPDPRGRRFAWLAASAGSLAVAGAALFLATRGLADLATHCDQISPVHLGLFAWIGVGSLALHLAAPRTLPVQLAALALIGAVTIGLMLGGAPQCRGGAFVALDPLVRKYWYAGVSEGLPVWRSPLSYAATTVLTPLFGLYGCLVHWRRAADAPTRRWWIDHALVLAGSWAIALLVARATATACALAALPLGGLILHWIIGLRTAAPPRRIAGYLGVVLVLMPALPAGAWTALTTRPEPRATNSEKGNPAKGNPATAGMANSVAMRQSLCRYDRAAAALQALPATDIFAPLDIGPDLLVRTHHRVVATGHHRGSAGMHDVIAAFMGSPDAARPIVARRHATLIALCPDIAEPWIYAHYAPAGLMAGLLAGHAPAWLEPVNLAPGSHLKFWRVRG